MTTPVAAFARLDSIASFYSRMQAVSGAASKENVIGSSYDSLLPFLRQGVLFSLRIIRIGLLLFKLRGRGRGSPEFDAFR